MPITPGTRSAATAPSTPGAHIATNLVRDRQRTRKFQFWRRVQKTAPDLSELSSLLPSGESSPESQILAREQAQQVSVALESLSTNQRTRSEEHTSELQS